MFDSPKFAPQDEEDMEDFHDYDDEEHAELDKLDDYDEDEEDDEEEMWSQPLRLPAAEPPAADDGANRSGAGQRDRRCRPRSR